MYNKNLEKCFCGKRPKLLQRSLDFSRDFPYYKCCDTETFACNNELCSRENWNATITRKKFLNEKTINPNTLPD